MLPILNGTASRVSKRAYFYLFAMAVVALALPLVYVSRTLNALAKDSAATDAAKEPLVEFLPQLTPSEEKILAELDKPTNFDFQEIPLSDVAFFIHDKLGIEVQLDKHSLDEGGISTDKQITFHIKNVSLRSALRLMLRPLDATFVISDEVLQIMTLTKAGNQMVTRTYPVGDLVEDNDYETLVKTIIAIVWPTTWGEVGGPGGIAVVKPSQSIVISQTDNVQDEVLQLLRSLRAARKAQPPRGSTKSESSQPADAKSVPKVESKARVPQKAGGIGGGTGMM